MLQHSRATSCEIALWADGGEIRLIVRNDGAAEGRTTADTGRHGTGLAGLAGRVLALGGAFTSAPEDGAPALTAAAPAASAADRPSRGAGRAPAP
ncbi:hypothetical protein [Streptomyces sp. SR-10]|uniref:hypothetical protein n=1 Tax=Streptomyces sp. SR-10 TaxID=3416442 RepID=UPI003CF8C49C